MTCIVGIVGPKGRMVIGGDSAVSFEGTHLEVMAETKVWCTGDYLMGASGDARGCNVARYVFQPPKPRGRDLDRFMATTFIDALRDAMLKAGHTFKEEQSRETIDTNLLIGVRGVLYTVFESFDIERPRDEYAAIGCGTRPALGALYATRGQGATAKRVRLALEAAETYDAAVRRPFVVISNEP